ncbi:PREDICTED: sorting nexin-29 isoform X2 [Nicrophorus vespilloides]|uniref:Sorting nexin-29 isoform X2 n=1 Tax=Nicrophorus vespilloides TaxID=110193 RepID=A0ABM1M3X3_NICVS|nr:PREDICTED: sorting nexin-29 isoform X2 [Nicrophorus vespilloides]
MSQTTITNSSLNQDINRLLNQLLECVQLCQRRFGGKTEIATEFDSCVSSLCTSLEAVFEHGLRNRPLEKISTLKQVSEVVTTTLHLNNDTPSYWPFIKKHLTRHEFERFELLKQVWTNGGKCKAWIRSSLNERSLERNFHKVLSDPDLLHTYYEHWAFLCDHERSNLLPNMAAGLASILFAVNIDKPELNSSSNRVVKPEPIIEAPLIEKVASTDKRKKKRKVAKQLISFDDNEDDDNFDDICSSVPSSISSVISETFESKQVFASISGASMEEESSGSSDTQSNGSDEVLSKTPQRKLSVENSGSRDKYPNVQIEGTLTPLEPDIGELTPVQANGDVEMAADISAVLSSIEIKNREEEQLKHYMGAVQLLKQKEDGPDYRSEAKLYEKKLVQVAEMHAELMDFNGMLQQNLYQKDAQIEQMRKELEEFKGPLNSEDEADRGCVNVWIPSAFLTGSGSEAHHVYQIYLRAGNDEWNIYRRYAQFHALHSDLKKLDSAISSFDFPPKKSLRNKDSSLVEDRRKRLQTYLRKILLHWPELSQCNSRFLLEQHLSFFKEQKDNKKRSIFNSRRSGNSSTENHYTGL